MAAVSRRPTRREWTTFAFLRAIIDWSAERHGTSPDGTVVAGISNGAFMAHRPACTDSRPAHALSAMLIHGCGAPAPPRYPGDTAAGAAACPELTGPVRPAGRELP